MAKDERGPYAWASTSAESKVTYRETDEPLPEYDGHHIQITLADFSGPHKKLLERGLIARRATSISIASSTSSMWTPTSRCSASSTRRAACVTRCSTGRIVNRNPDMTNRNFVPGYEVGIWALN